MRENKLNVASFFAGCGGFDLGFKNAGFNTVLANDFWNAAARTFKKNNPEVDFIEDRIENITEQRLNSILIEKGVKIDIVIGGPPCQCFTRLNNNWHNKRKQDQRNHLFKEYVRVIKYLKPSFVVMENVADLLCRTNEKGQLFKDLIIQSFRRAGYKVAYKVFETERYGVPQKRRRVIFLASNNKNAALSFPEESSHISTTGEFLKNISNNARLPNHEITISEPRVQEIIKNIPSGGYYEHLPERLKTRKIRNGKLVVVKRYGSYYRRLKNDEPSITITNNYMIHPSKNRYLTNREKAALHTFPLDYEFEGTKEDVSQQIANAVPPALAKCIATHLLKIMKEVNCKTTGSPKHFESFSSIFAEI